MGLGDISLGGNIIVEIFMDIEMVRLNPEDDGDIGRYVKIPKLKAGEFVYYRVFFSNSVERVNGRLANISN